MFNSREGAGARLLGTWVAGHMGVGTPLRLG